MPAPISSKSPFRIYIHVKYKIPHRSWHLSTLECSSLPLFCFPYSILFHVGLSQIRVAIPWTPPLALFWRITPLPEGLLPLGILADNQSTRRVCTQPLPPRHGQLGRKLQPARTLYSLDGDLEIGDRLFVGDFGVGEHECAHGDRSCRGAIFSKDHFVEMRRHGNVRRVPDHFICHAPFAVHGVPLGEVEGPGHDTHTRIPLRQTAAEILEVCPVVTVEALSNLGAHVR
jgi:hypothetical protein